MKEFELKKRTPEEMVKKFSETITTRLTEYMILCDAAANMPEIVKTRSALAFGRLYCDLEKAIQKFELDLRGEDEPF